MSKYVVYCILNAVDGKCYIGETNSFNQRIRNHMACLRKGTHSNYKLQNAYNEYGESVFKVVLIEQDVDMEDVYQREKYWMRYFKSETNGYNIRQDGGNRDYSITPELQAMTDEIARIRGIRGEKLAIYAALSTELNALQSEIDKLVRERRKLRNEIIRPS